MEKYNKKLIKWVKDHYWDSLEKDKDLILRHLRTFTGDNVEESAGRVLSELKPLLGCRICGGAMVEIRGRYPNEPKREVCPTCLQERMEQIHDISGREYGVPCQEKAT